MTTVKWSDSPNPSDAATFGTGANPTDFTSANGGRVYLHVTCQGRTVTRSFPVRPGPGYNPATLFAASEAGAWYDPSDLSTLWKDTAGTDPVTADGDAVARIDDKSGNENHLLQATVGFRPLYRTDGTLHWLQFAGTDDRLVCATPGIGLVDLEIWVGFEETSSVNNAGVVTIAPSTGDDFQSLNGLILATDISPYAFGVFGSTTFAMMVRETASKPTAKKVYEFRKTAATAQLLSDGVSRGVDNSFPALNATNTGDLIVGGRFTGGAIQGPFVIGNIYGIIIRSAVTSAGDRTSAREWMAAKSGVTL